MKKFNLSLSLNKFVERFSRFLIEFLSLDTGPPQKIAYIIIGIMTLIGYILSIDIRYEYKLLIIFIIILIAIAFLPVAVAMMFPLDRRVRILVRSYAEDEDIIIFLNNKIKEWLKATSEFNNIVINDTNTKKEQGNTPRYAISQIEKTEKDLLTKGRFLEALVIEASNFLEINKESIEHLIGLKIGVNKYIIKNINYNYNKVLKIDDILINPESKDREYYEEKRTKLIDDLMNKKKILDGQIEWNSQLGIHKKDIKTLIKIIKEESTGNAINLLVELLKNASQYRTNAEKSEQLKFLIKAADAIV